MISNEVRNHMRLLPQFAFNLQTRDTFYLKNDISYRAQYQMLEVIAKPFVLGFTLRLVKLFDVSLAKLWAQLFKRLSTLTLDEKNNEI